MDFRYAIFHAVMRAKARFSKKRRVGRMQRFIEKMGIQGGERIIDLGGSVTFWDDCPLALDITIVNLPGSQPPVSAHPRHALVYVEGDACNMPFVADDSFDIAFSNSVIEHVGPVENQKAFAREVHRVAPRYWVQTPSIWFPVEAHNNMPFWWAYPKPVKQWFIARWRRKLPAWTDMVEGTTVIRRAEMIEMFPDGQVWTERFSGFPKSYVLYK